jgi:hypothetical protein
MAQQGAVPFELASGIWLRFITVDIAFFGGRFFL